MMISIVGAVGTLRIFSHPLNPPKSTVRKPIIKSVPKPIIPKLDSSTYYALRLHVVGTPFANPVNTKVEYLLRT